MIIGAVSKVGIGAVSASSIGRTADSSRKLEGVGTSSDFASMLGEAIADVAQKLRGAEGVSIAGIKGTASTQEVVEKVMAAEQSLQAAMAVRDKVVSAYMEISRMAI